MNRIRSFLPCLLVLVCLAASAAHVVAGLKSMSAAKDMVSGWDAHMASIRSELPAHVRTAGYLERADMPDSTAVHDSAEFFLTQYGIAPVVLVKGFGPEWTIGNFGSGVTPEALDGWLTEVLGDYTLRGLGFGIFLIRDVEG